MPGDGATSKPAAPAAGSSTGSATVKASASSAKPQILTFSLDQRPRATRASQPKARTGCKTCKRRHVKCDEAKPACQRCVKWQGFCEGYEQASPPDTRGEAATGPKRQRRPKKDVAAVTAAAAAQQNSVVVWQPTEHQGMYNQDPDKVYFDNWLQVSDMLDGGFFKSDLWTRTIPQLSRGDPTLRYASMAIGALSQAMAMVPQSSSTPWTGSGSPAWDQASNGTLVAHSRHYRDAVVYYGRALRLAGERRTNHSRQMAGPSQGGQDQSRASHGRNDSHAQIHAETQMMMQGGLHGEDALRATMLSCILFICFETIHGNRQAALSHMVHGGRVVASWVESCFVRQLMRMGLLPSPPQSAESSPAPDQAESPARAEGSMAMEPKELPLPVLGTSPEPYVLQDEVIQLFQRLDCQAISAKLRIEEEEEQESFGQTHPQSISRTAYVMRNISRRAFPDLAEARRKWDTISHWLIKIEQTIKMHSVPPSARQEELMTESVAFIKQEPLEGEGPLDKPGHPLLDGSRFSPDPPSSQGTAESPAPSEEEVYPDWDQLNVELLGSFGAAWAPLYQRTLREYEAALANGNGVPSAEISSSILQAVNIQAHYHLSRMWARSRGFADLTAVHAMTPDFREYCRLGELLLRGRAGVNFSFDIGPTLGLYHTALACRDPAVRERAIRLLESYPRRDGFLDSRALVAAMRLSQEVEAENALEGSVEEQWARLRERRYVMDERLPILTWTCMRKNWQTGSWVLQDHIFRW